MSELEELRKPKNKELSLIKFTIHQEDKKISKEYGDFMLSLQQLLVERNESLKQIMLYINSLERDHRFLTPDMREAKDIPSFMLSFSKTQAWWNFDTSASIACRFGGDSGLKLIESYDQKLKMHLLNRISLNLPMHFKVHEMVVKINKDIDDFPEKCILDFRAKVAKLLQKDPMEILFLYAEEGCVKLTFLLSSTNEVAISDFGSDLEDLGVIFVCIDG